MDQQKNRKITRDLAEQAELNETLRRFSAEELKNNLDRLLFDPSLAPARASKAQ